MAESNIVRLGRTETNDNQWYVKEGATLGVNTHTFVDGDDLFQPVKFDVIRASKATRVNEYGLIELVDSNVARIDYSKNSKGQLLAEKEKTNSVFYSESFNETNWSKLVGVTVSVINAAISPDGTQNADIISGFDTPGNNIVNNSNIRQGVIGGAIGDISYTFSVYLKTISGTGSISLINRGGSIGTSDFSHKQVHVTNEWRRYTFTKSYLSSQGASSLTIGIIRDTNDTLNSVIAWGAQIEEGLYATSYIPNLSTGVSTRNTDVVKSGNISHLLGQTEGTIFIDFEILYFDAIPFVAGIYGGGNEIYFRVSSNGISFVHYRTSTQASISTAITLGRHKVAVRYKNNDWAFYLDGVLAGADTSGTFTGVISTMAIGYSSLVDSYIPRGLMYNNFTTYDRGLSNLELAEITTPITEVVKAPQISGDAFTGSVLSVSEGTWSTGTNGVVTSSYIWQLSGDNTTWYNIYGTTDMPSYTILQSDLDKYIRVLQTVTDGTTTHSLGSFSTRKVRDLLVVVQGLFDANGYTQLDSVSQRNLINIIV